MSDVERRKKNLAVVKLISLDMDLLLLFSSSFSHLLLSLLNSEKRENIEILTSK